MKYFDSHAHINTEYFKEDVEKAITLAKSYGVVKMIMPSTNIANSLKAIELAQKYDFLFAAVGLHPADTFDPAECKYLEKIDPDTIKGIGEVGIDLYRDTNPPLEIQKIVFIKHIKYAIKHNKVLIIHMRDAVEEVYDILAKYKPPKFVMHSFVESVPWALRFIQLGGYISFSGIVTFKNAPVLKQVAKRIPLNKIICETDAPFLTPVPHRGKPNTPAYVKHTVDYIAAIRDEDSQEVVDAIYKNTIELFLNN